MSPRRRGNGEGSISRHKKSGLWMARYWAETPKGLKRKTVYGKTREVVRDKMAKALADRADGLVFDDENVTVGEYLDSWLEGVVRGSVRRSTYERYEVAVRVHIKPALGRLKLGKLTPARVQSFYRGKLDEGCAPASVNKLHVTLHKALDQAVKWHMVPGNVAEVVRAPRPAPEEMRTLSAEEARRLLEAARGDKLEALFVLAVTTGMRQGELLALKWQDVDLENAKISVRRTITMSGGRILFGEPKTKKSRRTILLTEAAVRALREHLDRQVGVIESLGDLYQDQGLIFASEVGTPMNPTNLRRRSFASLLKRAGLPQIRFHDLRHTCATLLLSRNVHPKYVQELLGHANIAITLDTYSHVIPGMGNHAAKAMEEALS
ncbi:MAG: site-specific integrase [Actinomycetota bacterium]|nr:site-specific integrase [Actinomycetota bacterium]